VSVRHSRRRLLSLAAVVATGLAGCSGSDAPDSEAASATATETTTDAPDSEAASATEVADLDLREANVVAVGVEPRDGAHHFDVTLLHDDDGEDGYANWWQVETLAGERLGRRDLAHAHGTREFTRSTTVSVPDGTTCVVVRGHDQTHGYGGQAMLVNVEAGTTTAVRQGPDRQSMAGREC